MNIKHSLSIPSLDVPASLPIEDGVVNRVSDRLLSWMNGVGFSDEDCNAIRDAGIARMAVLNHPECDSFDRLLFAAQCFSIFFSIDDYCDEKSSGVDFRGATSLLMMALTTLESPGLQEPEASILEKNIRANPMLNGLSDCVNRLENLASPSQVARLSHEVGFLFTAMSAEAGWRQTGVAPTLCEYAAFRKMNSFLPVLALIDVVHGFEVSPGDYYNPAVRKILIAAANAATMVNDIFSAAKEVSGGLRSFNFPVLIAKDRQCDLNTALDVAVKKHNAQMRTYQALEADLLRNGASEPVKRYLKGLRSWVAGNLTWHRNNKRYPLTVG